MNDARAEMKPQSRWEYPQGWRQRWNPQTKHWLFAFAGFLVLTWFSAWMHTGIWQSLTWLFAASALVAFGAAVGQAGKLRELVLTAMAVVLGLTMTIASLSRTTNSPHPDELSHLTAYQYYLKHILPPAMEDPDVVPSISPWGYSYLFELDVVYEIAARTTSPLIHILGNDELAARTFDVGLWAALLLLVMFGRPVWQWVMAVMLLSPQAWYLFAYINADAFPLALSFICAGLIAERDGPVGRFLRHGGRPGAGVIVFVVVLGLLIVSKRNFIPLIPGFLLWLTAMHLRPRAWMIWSILLALAAVGIAVQLPGVPAAAAWHGPAVSMIIGTLLFALGAGALLRQAWKHARGRLILTRLVFVACAAIAVAAPRIGWDFAMNGLPMQKAVRENAMAERYAWEQFKPSSLASGKAAQGLAMARQGKGLLDVFVRTDWIYVNAASAFGVYGGMSVVAPRWVYAMLWLTSAMFCGLVVWGVRRRFPVAWGGLVSVVVMTTVLVVLSSLLHSWVDGYNPQGRYLLPALAMLALLSGTAMQRLKSKWGILVVTCSVVVGLYSYAAVALPGVLNH